jgi:hypothetical protein
MTIEAAVAHAIDMHLEVRKATSENCEDWPGVSALSQHPLERHRNRGHDQSIQPHARHQHEFLPLTSPG